ncbi:MAG: ATP synthase F1 subunit gamma [Candidatus Cloacimonas sp.]|nr:ATP synthase F1 subunit gamma [Candidatus Cloacimonadota bacterium]
MSNIRDIKNRIDSVRNTRQITNAMKMVAASKLRKAQDRIVNARPYADYLEFMIRSVKYKNPDTEHPMLTENQDKNAKRLLVVMTSDRGLCGSFNSNIIRSTKVYLEKHPDTDVICIGRKGYEQISKLTSSIIDKYFNLFNEMNFNDIKDITKGVLNLYLNNGYARVDVIYNEFKSAIQQNIIEKQILPIIPPESPAISQVDYLYEPDENTVIEELGTKYIDVEIWRMMLESSAAEQGARMTAMDNATENATELIDSLTLLHNRARQAAITTEIIEIASGAEAINE